MKAITPKLDKLIKDKGQDYTTREIKCLEKLSLDELLEIFIVNKINLNTKDK